MTGPAGTSGPAEMTPDEQAEAARILEELRNYGYQEVESHGDLRPGTRIRHTGHRWPEALDHGTGVVVAITHKPDSAWSKSWGRPDVELIALWDDARLSSSRLSQLAQYHVVTSSTWQ